MHLQSSYIEETEATATAKGGTYGKKYTQKQITHSEKNCDPFYTEKLYKVFILGKRLVRKIHSPPKYTHFPYNWKMSPSHVAVF